MSNSQFLLPLAGGLILSLAAVALMLYVSLKLFPGLFYTDRVHPHHYRIVQEAWGEYRVQWAFWWQPLTWHTAYKFNGFMGFGWGVPCTVQMYSLEEAEAHLSKLKRSHEFRPVRHPSVLRKS